MTIARCWAGFMAPVRTLDAPARTVDVGPRTMDVSVRTLDGWARTVDGGLGSAGEHLRAPPEAR
ncbi:hypothetical protein [Gordonia rhizosphera]|uniref:Uncharacterized protein n=1 Tax=Gordonia rhizosphera NBRC 16068 TaxID=1108045 RepID=K6X0M9_9ACTN|nr:hypothetical protein [Gordonia rhizosphera]GAB92329.1 hypothetical protein GORHZ_171_00020 [Gordonia rhizosphera NBRC 16068]